MSRLLFLLIAIAWIDCAVADVNADLVLKVPDTFYQHPTRLSHPRLDSWHNRGKVAEKAGVSAFRSHHYTVKNCSADGSGKALILILPSMFYNIQSEIFHSEIVAKVFTEATASGELAKPLLTITGKGQKRGWLSPNSERFTYESYMLAFDNITQELQENVAFQDAMKKASVQNFAAACAQVDTSTPPESP
jgi:hypothetical protein